MPQAVLGSRAYPLPPEALRALSPELYDYLTLVHVRLFGAPAGTTDTSTRVGLGDLDQTNINGVLTDTTDHSLLTNLDADDHTQYLDTTRHAAVTGNPHGVTAADVGNTTAQWNADQLQGESLSTTTPAEGQVLTYTAGSWTPGAGGGGGGTTNHAALTNLDYASAAHTGFEPALTKGDLTAASSKITIGGTGTGALIGAGATVDVAQANLDHGSIGGLADNDHTQYVNAVSDTASLDLTLAGQSISGTVLPAGVDHGGLGGLADNDHTQYVNAVSDTASLDLTLAGQSISGVVLAAGVDHGGLGGLGDDDHSQYLLAAGTRALTGNWDAGSFQVRAETFQSDVTTGTAPLTVASTTKVANLNADLLDDQSGAYYLDSTNFTGADWTDLTDAGETALHTHDHGGLNGLGDDDHTQYLLANGTRGLGADWDAGSWQIRAETFQSDVATGTAPFTVASTTVVANLNADLLDGQEGTYYLDSANFTGTDWTDLTDAGATTLHKHDHGGMDGLADDDHTQYALLTGRAGGQTLQGGTAATDHLKLEATSNASPSSGAVQVAPTNRTYTGGHAYGLQLWPSGLTTGIVQALGFTSTWSVNLNIFNQAFLFDDLHISQPNDDTIIYLGACASFRSAPTIQNTRTVNVLTGTHMGMAVAPTLTTTSTGTFAMSYSNGLRYYPTVNNNCTVTTTAALYCASVGGSGAVTNELCVDVADLTMGGTLAAALRSAVSSGSGKWCLYSTGTAASAHAGKLRLGTVAAPTDLLELYGGNLYIQATGSTGYIDMGEYATSTDAPAPSADRARLYVRDNGAGKEQFCVRFATGAVQVVATEP